MKAATQNREAHRFMTGLGGPILDRLPEKYHRR